ncbi:MAG: quinol:cytochrome C oxidoreductase [Planctomycetota bacterium]
MQHSVDPSVIFGENRTLGPGRRKLMLGALGVGVVATAASIVLGLAGDGQRFQRAWLVSLAFFLTLSLGSLFFVAINHVTRAGWSIVVRRQAELFASLLPLLALLTLPVLVPLVLGSGELWIWNDHAWVEGHHHMHHKEGWLSMPFFVVRVAIYFAIWTRLARSFLRNSLAQDADGARVHTGRNQRLSAPALLLFALSVSFASFDLLMSLDPLWFSTIYGVYIFAGATLGCFAVLILTSMLLQRSGRLEHAITTDHYHDLGKFMFAFVVFWAYIAFSQFMLIWYGDLPEETRFFANRATGVWGDASYALLFGQFVVPFAGLLSRHVKRNKPALAFWAVWILVFHWLDMQWLVMPNELHEGVAQPALFHVLDVTCLLAVGGIWVAGYAWLARERSLVPERDPYLGESLAFKNV